MEKIIQEFTQTARKRLKKNLKRVVLFGSRARGDFSRGSDYDVLLVVGSSTKNSVKICKTNALDVCSLMLRKYSAVFGCLVWGEQEFELKKNFPIGINIANEGIQIWPRTKMS